MGDLTDTFHPGSAGAGSDGSNPGDGLRVIIPRDRIASRICELAGELTDCYGAGEIMIVGVMTGAFIFLADLMRNLSMPIRLDIVSVCSYPGASTRSRGPQLTLPPSGDLTGRDVLVVDDILDSGQTMTFLLDRFAAADPASLRTCVLLRKDLGASVVRPDADFVGFDVADEFVVGYGLDYDDLYRGLPDLCVLDPPGSKEGTE
ncbi:MAG: phosphoribosyltransferase family protein [Phycisphaerae bacterium]|jgi:hypoxanthine phosphoribosyltransferase|nr:phosphoribosyltransferase family protein [Phycisphaerae bacterium]